MNKHLIVSAIAVLLICVGLSGCTDNNTNIEPSESTTYRDEEFIVWQIQNHLDLIDIILEYFEAVEDERWNDMETYANDIVILIDETLIPDCDSFIGELSFNYLQLRNEFKEYLSDYSMAFSYSSQAASYYLDGENQMGNAIIELSTNYMDYAQEHSDNIHDIISNLE